jgi:cell division protein FtsB
MEFDGMNNLAGICIFIATLAALSIPIIAVLKWKPKNRKHEERIEQLEKKLKELESRSVDQETVISELSTDVRFTTDLIEKR